MFAQFAGTSVWFATNAVLPEIEAALGLGDATAWLTGAVQVGFIAGTALLSLTGLADRFSPRWIFFLACGLAAAANAATLGASGLGGLVAARLICGAALAGIYPIGMKVAAGWYREGLGAALGWLVGALVLGTAFPHLLRGITAALHWTAVVVGTSALALLGGVVLAALVPDGPHLKPSPGLELRCVPKLWALPAYRASALGYFGHMWELYTLWALLPALIVAHTELAASLTTGAVIGVGALGCVGGGYLSARIGSASVARWQLGVSALCCLLAPAIWAWASAAITVGFLFVWGVAVVGDSPQLSALTARAAPPALIGTGLALATTVGFSITVVSLQVAGQVPLAWVSWVLLPGPLLGLVACGTLITEDSHHADAA